MYAKKFKIEKSKLMKKLWGDNYYNPEKKCFQTHDTTESGKKLDRCFVQFIMKPIIQLSRNILEGNLDSVWKALTSLNITMKPDEKSLEGKHLYRCIFKKWINAADALLQMIITKLPSPLQA